MTTLRKTMGALTFLIAAGLSSNASAAKVFGLYADGHMSPLNGKLTQSTEEAAPTPAANSVPINLYTEIEDATTYSPLKVVLPGESIILNILFDQIGEWPIDFSTLIGQTLTLNYTVVGDFQYHYQYQYVVAEGDENLIGIGFFDDVPTDAAPGKIAFLGGMTAQVATLTANHGWSLSLVR